MRETPVQQKIRLEAGSIDVLLQRNNVGACTDSTGRLIRYGLMNDSKALNEQFKSGDLIGCVPVFITPAMVGSIIGRYVSVETKASDWHLTAGDERGQAQQRYAELVRRYGGLAGFARSVEEFRGIIGR